MCCIQSRTGRSIDHHTLAMPEDNIEFEFLILLKPHDIYRTYMKCINMNRKQAFLKYAKHMNGPLNLYVDDDKSKCPYPIRGIMTCNSLFAKLPKERVFVTLDTWYHEFLKSQMLELLYILRKLGAKNVHLTLEKKSEDATSVGVETSLTNLAGSAEVGIKNSRVKNNGSLIDLEASYDEEDLEFIPYNDIKDFAMDNYIFYLDQMQDWQDIITQRLVLSVKELKFRFNVSNSLQVDNKFYTKMSKLGLALEVNTKNNEAVSVSGVVSFGAMKRNGSYQNLNTTSLNRISESKMSEASESKVSVSRLSETRMRERRTSEGKGI